MGLVTNKIAHAEGTGYDIRSLRERFLTVLEEPALQAEPPRGNPVELTAEQHNAPVASHLMNSRRGAEAMIHG